MTFIKHNLDLPLVMFDDLTKSIKFDDITDGRKGANLVDITQNGLISLVRTTTKYKNPNQSFTPIHYNIMKMIGHTVTANFNNALIEIYNSKYCNMGYHSDQALDLDDNSYICLFSHYSNPSTTSLRKLKVKSKINDEQTEIILDHNSIVLFTVETNSKYLHKIMLDKNNSKDEWLGITFRKSKTFIFFNNELPYFYKDNLSIQLTLATDDQVIEFMKLRKRENKTTDTNIYDFITYTISPGDIMPVKND